MKTKLCSLGYLCTKMPNEFGFIWTYFLTDSFEIYFSGQYGIPEGVVFSFPVTVTSSGEFKIVEDIEMSDDIKAKIQEIVKVWF